MNELVQYSITGTNAREIATAIEDGILAEQIPYGATLPTVRALASTLKVSPATVASAYRSLQTRGVLSGRGRQGTKVSLRPPLLPRPSDILEPHLHDLAQGNPDPILLPPLSPLLSQLDGQPVLYGGTANRPGLLALAAYQFEADTIPTLALAILGGGLDAIERILQAHLKPGDRVAVEDPGFNEIFDLIGALGLVVEPVAIDVSGLIPAALEHALQTGVQACILTPRAQNPTGACLDKRRAHALRQLFDAYPQVLVIEDDHAGPVSGVPAFTVCHSTKQRWAVIRTVSKSLGPDLRLAAVTGDETTIARVESRQQLGAGWVSHILQQLVEAVWAAPATRKQLRRAAEAYTTRRNALIEALAQHDIPAFGQSGLNVWIPVREEAGIVAGLAAAGWAVRAGERYRLKSPPAIRTTVASLEPSEAPQLAADFARILQPARRTHSA